jgi:MerR family redox-sensitive transcriptional activator SoxR
MAELSVGDVAKRAGVKVSTLHFYEQKGLIASHRNSGNQRRYQRGVLRRIAVIKSAQNIGMSLVDISKEFAKFPPHDAPTKAQWQQLANVWKAQLDQRIAQLSHLRNELDQCIGCGCLSMEYCKVRNPDDVLSREGKGAVLWEE